MLIAATVPRNSGNRYNEEEILMLANALTREADTSSAAAAFSSVAGVLGGFSITIVVLALTPATITSNSGKDWVVGSG